MQLVLNALRKQNIVVEHFGQCHFNEPAPHVCPVKNRKVVSRFMLFNIDKWFIVEKWNG